MESKHKLLLKRDNCNYARRQFLRLLLASPLLGYSGLTGFDPAIALADEAAVSGATKAAAPKSLNPGKKTSSDTASLAGPDNATNVLQFEDAARKKLTPETFYFVADGADDMKTVRANRKAFDQLQIRARRLVDVSKVDTSVKVLGRSMETPIILAPVGAEQLLHPEGELASARAAASRHHLFMVSTVSNFSIGEIALAGQGPIWFQLYPIPDRNVTKKLLQRAEDAGAEVVALTVDGPVRGNREREIRSRSRHGQGGKPRLGNFEGLAGPLRIGDPSLTWDFVGWLKRNTRMKIILKGIVTHEDARLCVKHGADGLIVSNHGGRQEESNRGTMECLPEIVEAVDGRIPVLIDGGIRRGTDIFKALALGARAICIGRPYLWGLASFGADGVAKVLDLLRAELVRIMKLAGTPSIENISPAFVKRSGRAPVLG